MMKKRFRIGLYMMILCTLLTGCKESSSGSAKNSKMERYSAYFFDVFDTQTTVVGYAESQQAFDEKVAQIQACLTEYHCLYDIYNDYDGIANIKTINDNAGVEPVVVDQKIIDLLKMSKEMYEITSGKVNVAMGSVLSIWHEHRDYGRENPESATLPDMEALKAASAYMDIDKVIIDEEASTVYLEDAEMSLDVGGIGKGYAVQKTAEYAREIGLTDGLISVGGNAVALGKKEDGALWKIGVENPDSESEEAYVAVVNVTDACVVTSGDYQRYYEVDGVRYCHIIHPDTLMPANEFSSVTIVSADSGWADALSTAVFNMTLEEGMTLINSLSDIEAMWVTPEGEFYYSDGFDKLMDSNE